MITKNRISESIPVSRVFLKLRYHAKARPPMTASKPWSRETTPEKNEKIDKPKPNSCRGEWDIKEEKSKVSPLDLVYARARVETGSHNNNPLKENRSIGEGEEVMRWEAPATPLSATALSYSNNYIKKILRMFLKCKATKARGLRQRGKHWTQK